MPVEMIMRDSALTDSNGTIEGLPPFEDSQCAASLVTLGNPSPDLAVVAAAQSPGGGFALSTDLPYFKVWGQDSLGSYDLQSLSDHEFRVFWTLMFVGSVQPKRWHVPYDEPYLYRACASSKKQFQAAMAKLEQRRMVEVINGEIFLVNAPKWQETADAKRKRKQRETARERVGQVTDKSRTSHGQVTENVPPNVTSTRARNQKPEEILTDLSPPVRELRDEWMGLMPAKYQADLVTFDDMELLASDYATNPDPVREAIRAIKRDGGIPFPGSIRKRLKPAEPTRNLRPGPEVRRATP